VALDAPLVHFERRRSLGSAAVHDQPARRVSQVDGRKLPNGSRPAVQLADQGGIVSLDNLVQGSEAQLPGLVRRYPTVLSEGDAALSPLQAILDEIGLNS
jgi:hypothetical protein